MNPIEEATQIISSLSEVTAGLDANSRRLIEQRGAQLLVLAQRAGGVRSREVPAFKSTLSADVAAIYANSVNAVGARLRREDTGSRQSTMRAMDALDETPQVSDSQRLEAYQRSEAYAAECRQHHRQGNRLAVR